MALQMEKTEAAQQFAVKDIPSDDPIEANDAAFDRRITHKLDVHIMPWLFALWLLAFIDRSNIGGWLPPPRRCGPFLTCSIGNARLDGLVTDLGLTGNKYNVALTVFYILYVLVDVPSNLLLKTVGGGRYIPLLAIAWGIVGTCMGAVQSYGGLIACRLILGACEAYVRARTGSQDKYTDIMVPEACSGE